MSPSTAARRVVWRRIIDLAGPANLLLLIDAVGPRLEITGVNSWVSPTTPTRCPMISRYWRVAGSTKPGKQALFASGESMLHNLHGIFIRTCHVQASWNTVCHFCLVNKSAWSAQDSQHLMNEGICPVHAFGQTIQQYRDMLERDCTTIRCYQEACMIMECQCRFTMVTCIYVLVLLLWVVEKNTVSNGNALPSLLLHTRVLCVRCI